jgi:hypothetical protein
MKTGRSNETSVNIYHTTPRHIAEDLNLHPLNIYKDTLLPYGIMKENSIKQAGYYIFSFLSAFAKHYENSLFISARETFFPLDELKKILILGFY